MAAQKVQHPSKQSSIHSNIFVTNNEGSIEKPKRPVFHSLGFQLIVNACKKRCLNKFFFAWMEAEIF